MKSSLATGGILSLDSAQKMGEIDCHETIIPITGEMLEINRGQQAGKSTTIRELVITLCPNGGSVVEMRRGTERGIARSVNEEGEG